MFVFMYVYGCACFMSDYYEALYVYSSHICSTICIAFISPYTGIFEEATMLLTSYVPLFK